jgi:hypothetical protein
MYASSIGNQYHKPIQLLSLSLIDADWYLSIDDRDALLWYHSQHHLQPLPPLPLEVAPTRIQCHHEQ